MVLPTIVNKSEVREIQEENLPGGNRSWNACGGHGLCGVALHSIYRGSLRDPASPLLGYSNLLMAIVMAGR